MRPWPHLDTYIYIYIHNIYAVGSISGPHLPIYWISKWSTFTLQTKPKQHKNIKQWKYSVCFIKERSKNMFQTKVLGQQVVHMCLQTVEPKCGPLIDPSVDHVLNQLFVPRLKPYFVVSQKETYIQTSKHYFKKQNTIIFTFADITAPFDFTGSCSPHIISFSVPSLVLT